MTPGEAKDYLIRNEVWDEDYALCAMKIAQNIISDHRDNDYYAVKYGRRAIMALCEVYADKDLVG